MALELGRKTIDLPLRDITSLEEAKKILREWKRILEDAIRGSAGDITNVFNETNEDITNIDNRVTVLEGGGGSGIPWIVTGVKRDFTFTPTRVYLLPETDVNHTYSIDATVEQCSDTLWIFMGWVDAMDFNLPALSSVRGKRIMFQSMFRAQVSQHGAKIVPNGAETIGTESALFTDNAGSWVVLYAPPTGTDWTIEHGEHYVV